MKPEPAGGESAPLGERILYAAMWLTVIGLIVGPVAFWLAGHGSMLGAFVAAPLVLLVASRFTKRRAKDDDAPPD